jgi:hypothetical protein
MLSSSPSKIHEPLVIGVSPRLPDRRRRQELRNTRDPVGAENPATASDQHLLSATGLACRAGARPGPWAGDTSRRPR